MVMNYGNNVSSSASPMRAGQNGFQTSPKNKRISNNQFNKVKYRDTKVLMDPFGVTGKAKVKDPVKTLSKITSGYKDYYRSKFMSQLRDSKQAYRFEMGSITSVQPGNYLLNQINDNPCYKPEMGWWANVDIVEKIFEDIGTSKEEVRKGVGVMKDFTKIVEDENFDIKEVVEDVKGARATLANIFKGLGYARYGLLAFAYCDIMHAIIKIVDGRYSWCDHSIKASFCILIALMPIDVNGSSVMSLLFEKFGSIRFESAIGESLLEFFQEFLENFLPLIIAGLGMSAMPGATITSMALSMVTHFSRIKKGVGELLKFVKRTFEYIIDVATWWFQCGLKSEFPSFDKRFENKEFKVVCAAIDQVLTLKDQQKLGMNYPNYFQVCNLMKHCEDFIASKFIENCLKDVLKRKYADLKFIRDGFCNSGFFSKGMRPEPDVIVLQGDPGQGKSSIIEHLHSSIWGIVMKEMEPEKFEDFKDAPMAYLYARNPGTEFWDGYSPSKYTTVWDDFMQKRESPGSTSEVFEIIQAVNTFPFALHMAELAAKANNYFMSQLVIVTTNVKGDFHSNLINYDEALNRRLSNRYRVMLKDHFIVEGNGHSALRRFDPDKCHLKHLHPLDRVLTLEDVMFFKDVNGELIEVDPERIIRETALSIIKKQKSFESRMKMISLNAKVGHNAAINEWILDGEVAREEEVTEMRMLKIVNDSYNEKSVGPDWQENVNTKEDIWTKFFIGMDSYRYGDWDVIWNVKSSQVPAWCLPVFCSASAVGIIGAAMGAWYLYTRFCGMKEEKPKSKGVKMNLEEESAIKGQKFNPNNAASLTQMKLLGIKPEIGTTNVQLDQCIKKVINKNLYRVVVRNNVLGFGIFVEGTKVLVNEHFVTKFEEWIKENRDERLVLRFVSVIGKRELQVDFRDIQERVVKSKFFDLAIMDCGKYVQSHPNIIGRIRTFDDPMPSKALGVYPDHESPAIIAFADKVLRPFKHLGPAKNPSNSWLNLYPAAKPDESTPCILFSIDEIKTSPGDCGSIWFTTGHSSRDRYIYGIHVGSGAEKSLGAPLYQEHILELIESLPSSVETKQEEPDLRDSFDAFNIRFEAGWEIEKDYWGCTHTSLKRTSFAGVYRPCTKIPARLRPWKKEDGTEIDPYIIASAYVNPPQVAIPYTLLKYSVENLREHWETVSVPCNYGRRIFTFEEAILGIEGDKHFDAISRQTSAGYPYALQGHGQGKKYWFGTNSEYDLTLDSCVKLKNEVFENIKKMREGIRPFTVFLDNLKDEPLEKEKVDKGKARLFSACPLDYLIVTRMYFGAFSAWMSKNCLNLGVGIGLNPHSIDWTIMTEKLIGISRENICSGDFSKFDAHEVVCMLESVLEFINDWYDDEHSNIRYMLWREVVNSRHLRGNTIYMWNGSLPSGHPLTTIINSIYNHLLFRMAWGVAVKEGRVPVKSFDDCVMLYVQGDDNIFSTCYTEFGGEFLVKIFAEAGQKYTDFTKDGPPMFRNIEENSFIKRTFKYDPTIRRWVAPLEIDSIFGSLCYRKKTVTEYDHYKEVMPIFLAELSLWGKETYYMHAKGPIDFMRKLSIPIVSSKWDYHYTQALNLNVFGVSSDSPTPMVDFLEDELKKEKIKGSNENSYPPDVDWLQTLYGEEDGLLYTPEMGTLDDSINQSSTQKNTATENANVMNKVTNDTHHLSEAKVEEASESIGNLNIVSNNVVVDMSSNQVSTNVSDATMSDDLTSFLERPFNIYKTTISTSADRTFRAYTNWPPNVASVLSPKLFGYYGFRSDIELHTVINAPPTMSGIVRVFAFPDHAMFNNATLHENWTANVVTTSTLPHVDIQVDCQREARLPLKWWLPVDYVCSLKTPIWRIGICLLAPLRTGTSSNTVNLTMYISHKNAQVYGSSGTIQFESGANDAKNTEMKMNGPVSGFFNKFAKSTDFLKPIPYIGSWMPSISKTSKSLASAAAVWGFSSANDNRPSEKMYPSTLKSGLMSDQSPTGFQLSTLSGNSVPYSKMIGTEVDELALEYMTSTYFIHAYKTWATSMNPGDQVFSIMVGPQEAVTLHNVPSQIAYCVSPAYQIAALFQNYMGDYKFKIKFAKTQYHSGRLLFTYHPRRFPSDTFTETEDGPSVYRTIVDVSNTSEIEIVVPYVQSYAMEYNKAMGSLRCFVLDPLVAPDVVDNTVDLIVLSATAPGFKFLNYRGALKANASTMLSGVTGLTYTPQCSDFEKYGYWPESGCMSERVVFEKPRNFEQSSVEFTGESIDSLRQILKIEHPVVQAKCQDTARFPQIDLGGFVDGSVYVQTFTLHKGTWIPYANLATNNYTVKLSALGMVRNAFVGQRGGVRFRVAEKTAAMDMKVDIFDNLVDVPAVIAGTSGRRQLLHTFATASGSHSLVVPQIANTKYVAINANNKEDAGGSKVHQDRTVGFWALNGRLLGEVFECLAEDGDLQFFIGWPIGRLPGFPMLGTLI